MYPALFIKSLSVCLLLSSPFNKIYLHTCSAMYVHVFFVFGDRGKTFKKKSPLKQARVSSLISDASKHDVNDIADDD